MSPLTLIHSLGIRRFRVWDIMGALGRVFRGGGAGDLAHRRRVVAGEAGKPSILDRHANERGY